MNDHSNSSRKRLAARATSKAAATLEPNEQEFVPNRKRNILLAAERLFAAHGYHGVSIRDIAEEAGVPLALVGYYYGPKIDLYHEIFRQRSGYIQERLAALAHAQQQAPAGQLLEEIVKAFVLPVLKVAARTDGRDFLRLITRAVNEHIPEDEPVVQDLFDPLAHAFIDALRAAMPGARRADVAWCYQLALGALLHCVTDPRIERLSRGELGLSDAEAAGSLLVAFITEGLRRACAQPTH